MKEVKPVTFGQVIAKYRKRAGYNLREMALLVKKEDDTPISFSYLCDIENDRRNPPSDHIINQLAAVLDVSPNLLYLYARRLPAELPVWDDEKRADQVIRAYRDIFNPSLAA
jgi:transcriptional regulator with XRE-family HTH domain